MLIREARLSDASALARVHVDSWQTTYRGILPDAFIAEQSLAHRRQQWQAHLSDPQRSAVDLVAQDEWGRVVAFATAGPEPSGHPVYEGELFTLYVLKPFQRRGLGRLLVLDLCKRLLERRIHSMLVWVLKDNPARAFYEGLGGQFLAEQMLFLDDAVVPEVAYGWRDLHALVRALESRPSLSPPPFFPYNSPALIGNLWR